MRQLKCEMCGSVDIIKQDGVFVCQVCGCKYSIEEARKMMIEGTVDVSGSTVKIDKKVELEKLLQNGQTFINLRKFDSAFEVYETITKNYPEEFRGWIGLIISKTRIFSDIILDLSEINTWFLSAKQLASENDFKPYEKAYITYLQEVSKVMADCEIKNVENCIQFLHTKICANESHIPELKNGIKIAEEEADRAITSLQSDISMDEKKIGKEQNDIAFKYVLIILGLILLVLGFVAFSNGGFIKIVLGIFSCILGIILLLMCLDNSRKPEQIIEELQKQIKYKQNAICSKEDWKNNTIASHKHGIEQSKSEIKKTQEEILACEKYLKLGKEFISALLLSINCQKVGITLDFDFGAKEYRSMIVKIMSEQHSSVLGVIN